MVIGVFAKILRVGVEDLTVVVLVHELAHAYTHLGYDIDGDQWDTSAFAAADIHIVEGLAQFYTEIVCKNTAPRQPNAKLAFERLLKNQAPPYTDYRTWAQGHNRSGEIVRFSMIDCRSKGITTYQDFLEQLKETAENLPRRSSEHNGLF